LIPM